MILIYAVTDGTRAVSTALIASKWSAKILGGTGMAAIGIPAENQLFLVVFYLSLADILNLLVERRWCYRGCTAALVLLVQLLSRSIAIDSRSSCRSSPKSSLHQSCLI